ncbi:uncharacterized protein LY79DRAFT_155400 [Colletotrichum navitas]|uniref:Uncharacterized protein n=1 Tax=Colletotrichum navitas TaxID=681940 RepID=A0AAD8Q1Y7_9PEZI|nr:uncharacterized protein LY79DRAFT_155400 [Colletotrichum navitas]KAK1594390.1 hypothetical protein LY79DRAFT_155400 [Colletotrichum navitas]
MLRVVVPAQRTTCPRTVLLPDMSSANNGSTWPGTWTATSRLIPVASTRRCFAWPSPPPPPSITGSTSTPTSFTTYGQDTERQTVLRSRAASPSSPDISFPIPILPPLQERHGTTQPHQDQTHTPAWAPATHQNSSKMVHLRTMIRILESRFLEAARNPPAGWPNGKASDYDPASPPSLPSDIRVGGGASQVIRRFWVRPPGWSSLLSCFFLAYSSLPFPTKPPEVELTWLAWLLFASTSVQTIHLSITHRPRLCRHPPSSEFAHRGAVTMVSLGHDATRCRVFTS